VLRLHGEDRMKHRERLRLAGEIARRAVDRHGDEILTVAVHGSTARAEDEKHSELKIWIATRGALHHTLLTVYHGIPVEIAYVPAADLLKAASRVSASWTVEAGALNVFVTMYDCDGFAERLHRAAQEVTEDRFHEAARQRMVLTYETVGKMRNAWENHDGTTLVAEGRNLAWSVAVLLGLINRECYPGGHSLYEWSKDLRIRPSKYARLLDEAGGFDTVSREHIYMAGLELWRHVDRMAKKHGIDWHTHELEV
jgi:kanamycin nucleotidyltransferase